MYFMAKLLPLPAGRHLGVLQYANEQKVFGSTAHGVVAGQILEARFPYSGAGVR
jgi:hypothetical protein